ncbi:hypothetical protein HYFRA_00010715 [Hymenoscyphus fraxineus]|uniref:DUF7730 domain-containing protein n=1 Tax=Hymenoscyphus fraxineus TaxID=746836 RepID=A0A9N9PX50_9HELO|nr:hypothetical protein HYFRA_00010715 [Hymenoscyphus fraxineus]
MEQSGSEASRSPNHQANSIFLRFPRELRLSIYEQLLGSIEPGCKLHITENDITHKLSSVLCKAPPEDSPGIQHRPTSHAQRRWQSIHSGCRLQVFIRSWETPQTFVSAIGRNTTVKSSLDIFRNLLLTCKQIYLEANSVLYSRFTFVLSGLDPIQRFLSIGPQSLEHIRNLDIMWAPQIHSPDPSKRKADALDIQSNWMVICGAIRSMKNLKHARIRVYTLWVGVGTRDIRK